MDQQLKDLAKTMFVSYPSTEVFMITTDKQFFLPEQLSDAQAHQDHLNRQTEKNDQLIRITREDANKVEKPADEEVLPNDKSNKEQIIAYLTLKGVEVDSKLKKDELLAKLNEYFASLVPVPPAEDANKVEKPAVVAE